MTDCERARLELPALARGHDVSDDARAHVGACPACARELAELEPVARLAGGLGPRPSPELEDAVFELVALEDLGGKVARAPLEHSPPEHLERRALDRAGVLLTGTSHRRRRAAALATPALGAAAVALLLFGMGWRDRAGDLESRMSSLQSRIGPVGNFVDRTVLEGSDPSPVPTAELLDYMHDNFRLVVRARHLPPTLPGRHYEVWLVGERGRVSCGTFRVLSSGHVVFSALVGVDPRVYPLVEVTLEPDDGDPAPSGIVKWSGRLNV